jgi:uncharacterized coiled-coil DUF342 family protein
MSGKNFEEQIELANKSLLEQQKVRDELNSTVGKIVAERNQFNRQVRELIAEVQRNKKIRDQANLEVKTNKQFRSTKNQKVKEEKEKLRELSPQDSNRNRRGRRDTVDTPASLRRKIEKLEDDFALGKFTGRNQMKFEQQVSEMRRKLRVLSTKEDSNEEMKEAREKLRKAIDEQDAAHEKVQDAATRAQTAHDSMLKISSEVDVLREKADDCQKQLRRTKREADRAHQQYIVSRRVLHSMKDIIQARENPREVVEEVEELVELDPLTDEQIETVKKIIMGYYETSNPNLDDTARKHSDFIDSIEYELVPGAHRIKILSHRVGVLIGRKGGFIRPLQEKLSEHYNIPQIRIEMEEIKKSKEHSKNNNPKGYTEYNFGEEE